MKHDSIQRPRFAHIIHHHSLHLSSIISSESEASYSATIVACGRSSRLWHVLQLARQSRELSSNLDIQRAEEYWSFTCLFQVGSESAGETWKKQPTEACHRRIGPVTAFFVVSQVSFFTLRTWIFS